MQRFSCSFRGTPPSKSAMRRIRRSHVLFVALAAVALMGSAPNPLHPKGVEGVWYDDTGKGAVEIQRCGNALCGHIVWLRDPNDRSGQPLTDALNPSSRHRSRPICGLQVIGRLAQQPNGTWDHGWIYDPKRGKAYDVMLRLISPRKLVVTGYIGVKFLSESFVWHRAPDNLARCGN
jgi:uncharacterized protein (DUF2147 family)